jgi:uncharacterized protein HemX
MKLNMENTNTPQQDIATKKEGSVGAAVGSIIVILIIAAGGLYFLDILKQKVETEEVQPADTEVNSLEADLEATNVDDLDVEMLEIEAEIDAALSE